MTIAAAAASCHRSQTHALPHGEARPSPMSFAAFLDALVEPALMAVARHWDAVRGERVMPLWRDIDPSALAQHLPIIWAWRWDAGAEVFIGRLAGGQIERAYGCGIRGRRMDEVFGVELAPRVTAACLAVMRTPAASRSRGRVFVELGRTGAGERIGLPLGPDATSGGGVIGATVYPFGAIAGDNATRLEFQEVVRQIYPLIDRPA